jgi:hypothetical protein
MAAVSNNVRSSKVGSRRTMLSVEALDETVEITLPPEVLKKVANAAKTCGQTPSEWIHEALVEAVEHRTGKQHDSAGPKQ